MPNDGILLLAQNIGHEVCSMGGRCSAGINDWAGHSIWCRKATRIVERELIEFEAKLISTIAEDVRQSVAREQP